MTEPLRVSMKYFGWIDWTNGYDEPAIVIEETEDGVTSKDYDFCVGFNLATSAGWYDTEEEANVAALLTLAGGNT